MDIVKGNMGWIEVVVGPMFSGKSEELIRRLRRAEIARQRVQIFKPAIDERYAANEIVSHSGLGISSDNVTKAADIMEKLSPRTEVIGIDEAQFLGEEIVDVCTKLANLGKRVIVAGLDTDYRGRPFEPMLIAQTDPEVSVVHHLMIGNLMFGERNTGCEVQLPPWKDTN